MHPFITLRRPTGPLNATVDLPASKSIANRVAVLQALMPGIDVIGGAASEDTQVVQTFMARYSDPHLADRGTLNLQMAGTAARFLTALACVLPGTVVLEGSPRLMERPLKALIDALTAAGASIECMGKEGQLPLRIKGNPEWQPRRLVLHHPESSQMLSALLLLGPHWQVGTVVEVAGDVPSEGYTRLTLNVLMQVGVVWQQTGNTYTLAQRPLAPARQTVEVESDWSSACYWLAWLRLLGGQVTLKGLKPPTDSGPVAPAGYTDAPAWGWVGSAQPDAQAAQYLLPGCQPQVVTGGLRWALPQPLPHTAFNLDCALFPDQAQTFAVLAAMAEETSLLTGLHTLPTKETQRILSTGLELARVGCYVQCGASQLHIRPTGLIPGGLVKTYQDHRMALAFSLLAAPLGSVQIENPDVVRKSYPDYWLHVAQAGFSIEG